MSDLMSKNLQNKLRLDCRMDSKTADTDKDLLAEFVIRAENRDVVASIFGDKDPSVYGDMENDDMLDFFYEPENVLNNWSKWQFELWVERNIEEIAFNWENRNNPEIIPYRNLI